MQDSDWLTVRVIRKFYVDWNLYSSVNANVANNYSFSSSCWLCSPRLNVTLVSLMDVSSQP